MACGHQLCHYTSRCPLEARATCKKDTQKRFINDTCADCNPQVRRKMLRASYEYNQSKLMEEYVKAKATGNKTRMASLEVQMTKDVCAVRAANYEIGLVRNNVDVDWKSI